MTLLRSALFALALVLVTPPYAILALLSFPLPRMARYRLISAWSRMALWLAWLLCGIRWKIEGRKNLPDEPAVILSQHQSAWETLAFQEIFPPQVQVLKRELLWIPFFGWGLAMMSPIAIDRSRGAAMRGLAQAPRLARLWVMVFEARGRRVRAPTSRAGHGSR
jgi:1-acyl-sn-glycerol-3-phosphate acyltransferase